MLQRRHLIENGRKQFQQTLQAVANELIVIKTEEDDESHDYFVRSDGTW